MAEPHDVHALEWLVDQPVREQVEFEIARHRRREEDEPGLRQLALGGRTACQAVVADTERPDVASPRLPNQVFGLQFHGPGDLRVEISSKQREARSATQRLPGPGFAVP
jgi:hypothetical protein